MSNNDNEKIALESESTPQKARFFWGQVGMLISGLAAGILVAVIMLVSYGFVAVNNRIAFALTDLTNRFNQSINIIAESQKSALHAEQSMRETSEALKAQAQLIADIQQNLKTNKNDFLMMEVSYLVKMANDILQYENNIPKAIQLLQSADQDIATLNDPTVFPVRKALALDLAALQSIPPLDIQGVYLQLAALRDQVDKLPLINQLLHHQPDITPLVNDKSLPWWRRGLNSLKQALERIVIVRKNLPNAPFIAPDQQIFLYQNLHVEIEKAQWALLHKQPEIYRLSVLQAMNWIKQYAVSDSPVTKQILQNLSQLQQINVLPSMPNLTALPALQNYKNAGK